MSLFALRRGLLIVVTGLLIAALAAPPARAGEPAEQLASQVRQVFRLLEDPALRTPERAAERREALRTAMEQIVDFGEMAKRALGRYWPERTVEERREFVLLFTNLLERAYLSKIELYDGEQLEVLGDTVNGDEALVRSRLVGHGSTMEVSYRMIREATGWRVWDVLVEGVSLVENYRAQFYRILRTSSYAQLLTRLRSKQAAIAEPGS